MATTLVVREASSVLCRSNCIEYTVEGSPEPVTWKPTEDSSCSRALLVRGRVFQGCEVLSWETVAEQLLEVADLPDLRRYFSRCVGSFWAVYVCSALGDLCVFAVSDTVGVVPMWMALGPEFILLSPYGPSEQVPLAAPARQVCPRLMHRWSMRDGLEDSMPDSFFGLHPDCGPETAQLTGRRSAVDELREALVQAVRRCIAGEDHVGLLFSGGLDSGLLAWLFKGELAPCRCSCYTVGFHMEDKKIKSKYAYPEDLSMAEAAAAEMALPWEARVVDLKEAEALLFQCAPLIADLNSVKASVGMTMLAACQMAARDGVRVVLSGLGSEEAFAGYQRHLRAVAADDSGDATRRDRTLGLAQMWHRDLQRDFAVAASAHVEIRYPFLDAELLSLALTLPSSSPQREPNSSDAAEAAADGGKGALRQVARALEAPRRISERRKRAAQYGSRIYNALKILSNEAGKQQEESRYHQANYVMSVPGASHSKVAILLTSGYHSIQVYCLLRSWRCEIACIIPPDEETARARAVSFAREVQLPLLEKSAPLGSGGYDMPALIEALKFARENLGVEVAACGHVCDLDLWGSFAAACDCADLRAYAPEWGSCPASQSSMRRIVHDGTVLQVRKFPDPSLVGCTITCPQEADLLLEILRSKCGPEATDDTDAGLVDCDFVSSPFLPCGVREASSVGVTLSAQQRDMPILSHQDDG